MHTRRSIRLPEHDYRTGIYFVTLCTQHRVALFGRIQHGAMQHNAFGDIVREEWERTAGLRAEVILGEYVVMPDHFHALIALQPRSLPARAAPADAPRGAPPSSLGAVLAAFKGVAARRINLLRNTPGVSVWQRNYWERWVRDDIALARIARYIALNPLKAAAAARTP